MAAKFYSFASRSAFASGREVDARPVVPGGEAPRERVSGSFDAAQGAVARHPGIGVTEQGQSGGLMGAGEEVFGLFASSPRWDRSSPSPERAVEGCREGIPCPAQTSTLPP